MPLDIGLLSDASLIGVDDATRNELQKQATSRFLLGSILSGRPDIGFTSAINTPNEYIQGQQRIMDLKEKERQQAEENAWLNKYQPNKYQEINPQYMGPVTPDVTYSQNVVKQSQQMGLPTHDISGALRDLTSLRSPRQAAMLESFKASLPKAIEGGTLVGPAGEYIGTLPSINVNAGLITGANVVNGKIVPYSMRVPGAATVRGEMISAEESAKTPYQLEDVKLPDGTTIRVPRSTLLPAVSGVNPAARVGAPTSGPAADASIAFKPGVDMAPKQNPLVASIPQTAGNVKELSPQKTAQLEAYKPILTDAYEGYKVASSRAATLDSLKNILNRQDFDTNAFSNAKSQLTGFLNAAGIATDQQKDFLNSAIGFRQGVNAMAGQSLADLKGSTSNFDVVFSKEKFAGLTDPKAANEYAIDLMAATDKLKKEKYNFIRDNPSPDVLSKWENSPQGQASVFEDPRLRKYLPTVPVISGPNKGQTAYKMPDGTYKLFK